MRAGLSVAALMAAAGLIVPAGAVIFLETADPNHHSTTPGDNSGWQYEGKFNAFLGVPIAPHFFITATHIGGRVGDVLNFHGDAYTTIAAHPQPGTDLQIWEVDHAKPFPTFAPLASATADTGTVATIIGRGTRRGAEVTVAGVLKGWKWGPEDYVQRWGRNLVDGATTSISGAGEVIYCNFDSPGLPGECHLSSGDSGGGLFVLENGLWRLAGIHYAVEGPFRNGPGSPPFSAALTDQGGLEIEDGTSWSVVPDTAEDIPSGFFSSRISTATPWILSVTGWDNSLPPEDFAAWLRLYFPPTDIVDPQRSGSLADPDGDGLPNLIEYALNLDPTFAERPTMEPDTGLRGLPLVRVEEVAENPRLTIEFVRRTSASGAGISYTPEFSSDLENWETAGTEIVTAINPRWERIKFVDAQALDDPPRRFARLRVTTSP